MFIAVDSLDRGEPARRSESKLLSWNTLTADQVTGAVTRKATRPQPHSVRSHKASNEPFVPSGKAGDQEMPDFVQLCGR